MPAAVPKLSRIRPRTARVAHAAASCAAYVAIALVVGLVQSWPALFGDEQTAALLQGPDDHMRVVQVTDWLEGQAWLDTRQRRLDPPDGGVMHWSRIADLPLAASVALATPLLGGEQAMQTAVILVPALLGGALVALFFWLAAPLVPAKGRAMAALLTLPALILPLTQLRPGRVDHHGLQMVLVALAAGLAFRSLKGGDRRLAAAAGAIAATSLAVGLETLPFIAATAFAFMLATVVRADSAPSLAAFGFALAATAPALLLLTAPLADWSTVACDHVSLPHLTGAVGCAVIGAIAVALQRSGAAGTKPFGGVGGRPRQTQNDAAEPGLERGWRRRLIAVGGAGVAVAAVAALLFPQCLGSPYAELAPEARYWLDRVSEARSLPRYFASAPGTATGFALLPFVGALVAAARLRRGGWTDPLRLATLALALSGVAVGWWQIRGLPYAALVGAIALLPLTAALSARAGQVPRPVTRLALRLCVPIAYLTALILPVLVQVIVRPSDDDKPPCTLDDVLPALQDRHGLGRDALTIAAPINFGPELLLRTHHKVLAAPYHRSVRGIVDIREILAGTEAEVMATVAERGVDAIIFCPGRNEAMAYPDRQGFLSERLREAAPDWLVPVGDGGDAIQLYLVQPHGTFPRPAEGSPMPDQ